MNSVSEPVGTLDVALGHAARLLERDAALAAEQASEILKAVPGHPHARLILGAARRIGAKTDLALEVLNSSAATSAMLKVRGPMVIRNEFPAQMKLDLFMKDIHLMQEAAAAVGAPLPFTDLAERLYAAAQAAGHGGEDLAVVVTALEKQGTGRRKAPRSATSTRRRAKPTSKIRGRRRPRHR